MSNFAWTRNGTGNAHFGRWPQMASLASRSAAVALETAGVAQQRDIVVGLLTAITGLIGMTTVVIVPFASRCAG
jgi:hypothetical protein